MFNQEAVLNELESLRRPNGAFVAAPSEDYFAMWLRDMLYVIFAYYFLGDYEQSRQGMRLILDVFHLYKKKIIRRIASPVHLEGGVIPAKCHADTFEEITHESCWGHHQTDALGLFLYLIGNLDYKYIHAIRNDDDIALIQLIVYYLRSVEYWKNPDHGMWEECYIRHSSSIGSVIAGLNEVKSQRIAEIPEPLIQYGYDALQEILPYESRDTCDYCRRENHITECSHDCDSAQLSLIWPYHLIVSPVKINELISRIVKGHRAENGVYHCLVQERGLQRYYGDNYYRSGWQGNYRSAPWPMFDFWLSIVFSQLHERDEAKKWFERGVSNMVEHKVPEAYKDGKPNNHTPLAWGNATALIAWKKLNS